MPDALFKNAYSLENDAKVPWLGHHVHPEICTLGTGHLLALVRFKGVPHDTRDKNTLNREFMHEARCFKALGKQEGANLKLQTYTFKQRIHLDHRYRMELPIIQELVDVYTHPFRNGTFRQVGYGMALILKYRDLDDGISRMIELLGLCREMLGDYGVSVMGMEERDGKLYSQIGRFYSFVLNGIEKDIPITDTRLGDCIIESETAFGAYDYVENRPYNGQRRFASTYDLRDFPSKSVPGMWDEAIDEQYDFCMVQSFLFEDRNRIKRRLKVQMADLSSTEGQSTQTEELADSVQEVTQGKLVYGEYSASLIVFGDTPEQAVDCGSKMQSLLMAKDTGFIRSTSTNYVTWLTLFPGYADVIYSMPKSSENLACGFSLHATPSGKASGNPPGDGTALMPVMTENGGLFFLNAHDSPPGQNNTGEQFPGHKTTIAMTGAGKTTLEAMELLFFSRWNPMIFSIDYNNSLENLLRALNTRYFTIEPGVFTGIQPFQLPDSVAVRQYLFDTVVQCVGEADSNEEIVIQKAIDSVMMHHNVEARCFSLLLQSIPATGPNGLRARLMKWCRDDGNGRRGQYAWVLDSPRNQFDPANFRRLAFDCTKILSREFAKQHPKAMEVLLNTFFFLKRRMHETDPGCLLINGIAEFWAPLMFESTANSIMEILHAGRMRGEMAMMDTQVPEYVLSNERGPSVIQQTITQQWMANDKAKFDSYSNFSVTRREFDKIAELNQHSRKVLIKQAGGAVVIKMDLSGQLKYWLPLLSSTMTNVKVAKSVRESLGSDDPAIWVEPFLNEMVAIDVKKKLIQQNSELDVDDPTVWKPIFEETMRELGRSV
ncbi:VirB4 family type IV secretion system protein [Pectobacterium carotovorum]|uniref:VirB4 family type IV secretion system protein n=1 Tax=Pectobacterium carotovorum TaxID=554 RepID=UPI0005079BA6|nr:VirB4 family type IV secretion system protein [Pectobacterium carotovorum]KFW97761.1 conjugal transfer protein [Pectobacterium carotovorum subsp. carotovorum]KML64966.1 conjugal transfer protein [Pectobacterium carotovorum subsp. carotovorum ICMP 5702]SHH68961.1 type IV secretion system protein VirB4 [Pectobacterium carotovorum]